MGDLQFCMYRHRYTQPDVTVLAVLVACALQEPGEPGPPDQSAEALVTASAGAAAAGHHSHHARVHSGPGALPQLYCGRENATSSYCIGVCWCVVTGLINKLLLHTVGVYCAVVMCWGAMNRPWPCRIKYMMLTSPGTQGRLRPVQH